MVATELLKLAMETDEERKARLKKMVATTQLRLAPETEDERRARLEYLSDNPIYIPNNLYINCSILRGVIINTFLFVGTSSLYCTFDRKYFWVLFLLLIKLNQCNSVVLVNQN